VEIPVIASGRKKTLRWLNTCANDSGNRSLANCRWMLTQDA